MTNPFAAAVAGNTTPTPASTPAPAPAPAAAPEPAAAPKGDLGFGDPFATPVGIAGDGERIQDFVGNLLLIKPTECIPSMGTTQGEAKDVIRADMAVLDDAEEPGKRVLGVLLFQQALKREAKGVLDGPLPYLLTRLKKGTTSNGKNTLYTFEEPTEADIELARMFNTANKATPL